ncbi:hypothetical protein G6F35_018688 [Rhizopus arrhizus]|nr:hypothetical protein G6F35_018688 [Rhizopus arrhizus]KAG1228795.1 hypothetical protein G6F68_019445 [Rhizopus microsporus]
MSASLRSAAHPSAVKPSAVQACSMLAPRSSSRATDAAFPAITADSSGVRPVPLCRHAMSAPASSSASMRSRSCCSAALASRWDMGSSMEVHRPGSLVPSPAAGHFLRPGRL